MGEAKGGLLLSARGLVTQYGAGDGAVHALNRVDIDVGAGETVAVTGPSGCGKSTLLQPFDGPDRTSGGEITIAGTRVDRLSERALANFRCPTIGFVYGPSS